MLLSSHALTELEDRADRVIIVDRGIKIADGTLDELRHIARLPTRIGVRLSAADAAPGWTWGGTNWKRTASGLFEANVAPEDKIALLHDMTANPSLLAALTVTEPTLDELYAHFLKGQSPK